uniref:G_PROTEIN_RECEP_F1_2 domain-containing protein n=1 Tax=Rhabditophanes sp. KR3021 TaxID=114890 RepID=A0AC35UDL9_9BILA
MIVDPQVEEEFVHSLFFDIAWALRDLSYITWISLLQFMTINRFLTFYSPSMARKNTKLQVISFCIISWIIGISFELLKRFGFNIMKDYGEEDILTRNERSHPNEVGLFLQSIFSVIYIANPTFLFILYILAFIKVRNMSTTVNKNDVTSLKTKRIAKHGQPDSEKAI